MFFSFSKQEKRKNRTREKSQNVKKNRNEKRPLSNG